jgi:hypothetical protein
MSDGLLAAYRAARYTVRAPSGAFTLFIDEPSADLAAAHLEHGVACSAFITAWNPGGQRTGDDANRQAQQALLAAIETASLCWWPGAGSDAAGEWTEESLLVFGMDAALAQRIGSAFQQRAVIVAGADAVPRLLWL